MALSSVFTCVCVCACVYVGVCVSQHQQHLGTAGHLCVGLPLSLSLFLTHSLSISLQYSSLYKTQEKNRGSGTWRGRCLGSTGLHFIMYIFYFCKTLRGRCACKHGLAPYCTYILAFYLQFHKNLVRSVRRGARRGPVRVLGVGVAEKVASCASSMKHASLMKQAPTYIQALFRIYGFRFRVGFMKHAPTCIHALFRV